MVKKYEKVSYNTRASLDDVFPCWRCGEKPVEMYSCGFCTVACGSCYDPSKGSDTEFEFTSAMSIDDAIYAWNSRVEDWKFKKV